MGLDISKMGAGVAASEAERDAKRHSGFLGGVFHGRPDFKILVNLPENPAQEVGNELVAQVKKFLAEKVDTVQIDREDQVSPEVLEWLCENGYFALKIPKEYGGKELSQENYLKTVGVFASWNGAMAALVSASNSIGLTWPIKGYGTTEQKKKFLPLVGKAPSAFAFTEAEAGSDPGSMTCYAQRIRDAEGKVVAYRLNGVKWWTTNGPKSDTEFLSPLMCVIVKTVDDPDDLKNPSFKPCFSAFIVPTNLPGIKIIQRCKFEGLNGIYNGIWEMKNVYMTPEYLIGGKEGLGFRIALEALNTGRLSIAGCCIAVMKQVLSIGKWWGLTRNQWGKPIGYHELMGSGILASGLADAHAAEAIVKFAARRVDQNLDARLEAAVCKVFNSERCWKVVDNLMQMRGGRGYEIADSLAKRGDPAIPLEQIHRDVRVNRTFEGSSEILVLWVIREGTDEYKKMGDVFFERGAWLKKLGAAVKFGLTITKLLIPLLLPQGLDPEVKQKVHPRLHKHLRYIKRASRRLALTVILCSAWYMAKLVNKELLFRRFFLVASELFAMAAACCCGEKAELADLYCRDAKARINGKDGLFPSVTSNADDLAHKIAKKMLEGEYDEWLKRDIVPVVDQLGLKTPPPPAPRPPKNKKK